MFLGLFTGGPSWSEAPSPTGEGSDQADATTPPPQTIGYVYDYVTRAPVEATVTTFKDSASAGVDKHNCPVFKVKIDSSPAYVNGFFSVGIGSGQLFTTNFCEPTEYVSRTFLDQRAGQNQPWHRPRVVGLIKLKGNPEDQASVIELEINDFAEDLAYLREAAPKALDAALSRLSETGAKKKEFVQKLRTLLQNW
jgi:hypothetical protein